MKTAVAPDRRDSSRTDKRQTELYAEEDPRSRHLHLLLPPTFVWCYRLRMRRCIRRLDRVS